MAERTVMGSASMGTLIGIGVGPGDPGLVTIKAVETIRGAPAIAYPVHKPGASSRALETVKPYLEEGQTMLPLLMPMTRDSEKLKEAHESAAAAIIEAAAGGSDVAYLSLGDPLFYSTFGYLAQRFPGPVRVVSGVSSISAAAAAAGLPLASGDMPLVVVTGHDHMGLEAALGMNASIVVIKPRSLSPESLDLFESHGVMSRAMAALELGGPGERIIGDLDRAALEGLPYFSVLWIQPGERAPDV